MLEFEVDRFPLVVARMTGRLTGEDCDRHDAVLGELLERRQPFGLVVTAGDMPVPALPLVQRMGRWTQSHAEALARYNLCRGLYVPSPVVRGALSFVVRYSPTPPPSETFTSYGQAVDWVVGILRNRGLRVPDAA